MIILSLLLSRALATTAAGCLHPTSLDKTAEVLEAKARENNGELCASAKPDASTEDQRKLLGHLRDRAVERLTRIKPDQFRPQDMRVAHARLRAFQALRHSVLTDSPEGIRLSPAVALKNPPGLPRPENLTPDDVELVNRRYKAEIEQINAKLKGTSGAERRRLITQLATPLQVRMRDAGEVGYDRTVAATPALLFAPSAKPTDGDLEQAHKNYFDETSKAATKLRDMDLAPGGDALGLVFFGPAVKETMRDHPEMCGAYRTLLESARNSEKLRGLANAGLGLAAGGACLLSGVVSAGVLTAACFALTLGEFGVASATAAMSYREMEVLYGGLMQGAPATEYEKKKNESDQYVLAAGLSGAGAVGALGGIRSGLIAAEREKVIETAHLIGKGEVGRDGTPARIGNYTKDQIRRKIEEMKRSRFIDREERKELIRSGRVGIEDAEGLGQAEVRMDLLSSMKLEHLDEKSVRVLRDRLKACTNNSKNCEETFRAIAEAVEKESKPRVERIEHLERRLNAKAEETTDEKHFDALAESLGKLEECKSNPLSPVCIEAIAEAERLVPTAKVALQGPPPPAPVRKPQPPAAPLAPPPRVPSPARALPAESAPATVPTTSSVDEVASASPATTSPTGRKTLGLRPPAPVKLNDTSLPSAPNPRKPYLSSALPAEEISKLTFLTAENRVQLRQLLDKVSRDPDSIYRRRTIEKYSKDTFTPVRDLNADLQSILGDHVLVVAEGTKVILRSNARGIDVRLDPITRYFTVEAWKPEAFKQGNRHAMKRDEFGHLQFDPRTRVDEGEFVTLSHFGY